ncbi:MAG: 4-(cytidine 5'-diphospho)-2-C-methyl-D-erythritol kinase [Candidatus Sumerlaeia bacterium]|nr:4-(cytidine 5'-diphospho)-2-C-methyl-D-erythritol kinase [Candidatus Sumerlaeia bacterium]
MQQQSGPVSEWATAKINLFLTVLQRRPDGYHNIETVFQSVNLADRLTFLPEGSQIVLECDDPALPGGEDNLVVRAVEALRRRCPGRIGGMRIRLEKRIPTGSGLGGGSADAAAALRACNTLWNLELTADQLREAAAEVGMDVPFLVEGGRAIGRERGERLEFLPPGDTVWAVLAVPAVSISTKWAYEQIDRQPQRPRPSIEAFVERLPIQSLKEWAPACFNSFEEVVFSAYPLIKEIKDRLLAAGCTGAFLSGSGSAVVGLTNDPQHARETAEQIRLQCRFAAAVRFLPSANAEAHQKE